MALGLTLIFGLLGIVNFSHYTFFTIGAYICLRAINAIGINFWVALPICFVCLALLGIILERSLISRFYGSDPITTLVFTFGMALAFTEIIRWTQGLDYKLIPVPSGLAGFAKILGHNYPKYQLFFIGITALVGLGVWLLLNKTQTGLIIRAGITDRDMVRVLGINVYRTFTIVFGLGAGLAGIAGVLSGPTMGVFPEMGADLMIIAFAVIVIGGMGSFGGTIIASVICGLISAVMVMISSPMASLIIFVFMAIVILMKPGGFFGIVTRAER
jgi:branched-chain amino acid transport system permease protein